MKHTIIYKPHCSECGELLHGNVSYSIYDLGMDGRTYSRKLLGTISPYRCPNCGTFFETIIIPQRGIGGEFSYNADEYDMSYNNN